MYVYKSGCEITLVHPPQTLLHILFTTHIQKYESHIWATALNKQA